MCLLSFEKFFLFYNVISKYTNSFLGGIYVKGESRTIGRYKVLIYINTLTYHVFNLVYYHVMVIVICDKTQVFNVSYNEN
jgi:hypothetical protein